MENNKIHPEILISFLIAVFILSAYWNIKDYDFISFDDNVYVTDNIHVKNGLTFENIIWAFSFSDKNETYWHPLTWLSHMLDCQLYGLNPGMHHRTNLIFHMANSLLLFFVLQLMTGAVWRSGVAAFFFALHPVNVDSVAWIAERKNVLSTFLWLLTMLLYYYYTQKKIFPRYCAALLSFALGLMAKPMLITLPFVFVLLDYWPLKRFKIFDNKKDILNSFIEKIPFFLLSLISVFISIISVNNQKIVITTEMLPMKLRIENAVVSCVNYIVKMIWPENLAFFYPFPEAIPLWKITVSAFFIILIFVLVFFYIDKRPYLFTGWLWFIGTFIPVSGIKQAGLWPAMADRWAYVPLIGIFIIIAWSIPVSLVKNSFGKKICIIIISAVIIGCTIKTRIQTRYWSDSITLYKHAVEVTENNNVAHYNLGNEYFNLGFFDKAVKHYQEALSIKPIFKRNLDIHNNLGLALVKENKIDEAIHHYYEALKINPEDADVHYNIGNALLQKGEIYKAVHHYKMVLNLRSDYVNAQKLLEFTLKKYK
ncbi:Tetratricopeptide repeat-containing protein [Desulfonema limicola]|uniref:Tetratricopeptide repeat-containing protein n=1 Tax=Desulfonema limicola TaxID=45656 RepID=A0A975GHT8_9BACT|nr:tetratricopeptide repeat protein [Desulfonema limicola]QTA81915.1 Tetratricopeptide repeat-containing protein [Desulfonema limicola]